MLRQCRPIVVRDEVNVFSMYPHLVVEVASSKKCLCKKYIRIEMGNILAPPIATKVSKETRNNIENI